MQTQCFFATRTRSRARLLMAIAVIGSYGHPARADLAFSWGRNDLGQLGDGKFDRDPVLGLGNNSSPAPVINLSSGVTMVAAGSMDGFALQNGGVFAWGNDNVGQLGTGAFSDAPVYTPTTVSGLSNDVTAIAAGDYHTLAIQNGGVIAWGDNSAGETSQGAFIPGTFLQRVTNLSSGVTAIAAGYEYSLAIQNGGVFAWGANWGGQLGNGTTSNSATGTPVQVTNLSSGVTAISAGGSVDVSTGQNAIFESQNLAIKNGAAYAWGNNTLGQLGNGTTTSSLVPVPVTNLSTGVTAIAAGYGYSLAVRNGNVYAWGINGLGELGDGTQNQQLTPELIDPSDLYNIRAVAAGDGNSYALSADGSLWVWGYNFYGELGLGSGAYGEYGNPQHLLPPNGYIFTSISAQGDGDAALATLAPVPEPGSVWLLGVGSVALLGRRWSANRSVGRMRMNRIASRQS